MLIFNFGYLSSGHCIYVRIRGCFSKPKLVRKQKKFGKPCTIIFCLAVQSKLCGFRSGLFAWHTKAFNLRFETDFLLCCHDNPSLCVTSNKYVINLLSIFRYDWSLLKSNPSFISGFKSILWTLLWFCSCIGNKIINWLSRLLDLVCDGLLCLFCVSFLQATKRICLSSLHR